MAKSVTIKKMIVPADGKLESATVKHISEKSVTVPDTIATAADLKAEIAATVKPSKGTVISSVVLKIDGKEVADTEAVTKASLKGKKMVYKVFLAAAPEAPAAPAAPEAPAAPAA